MPLSCLLPFPESALFTYSQIRLLKITQQTSLPCDAADMSAASHCRHVCCDTQQTRLLCDKAQMSAVSHSRHICWVTQRTCPLCDMADMSAV